MCDAVEDIIGVGIAGLINRVGGDYGGYSAGGWIDAVDIVIHPDIGVDGIAHALEFIDVFEGLSLKGDVGSRALREGLRVHMPQGRGAIGQEEILAGIAQAPALARVGGGIYLAQVVIVFQGLAGLPGQLPDGIAGLGNALAKVAVIQARFGQGFAGFGGEALHAGFSPLAGA